MLVAERSGVTTTVSSECTFAESTVPLLPGSWPKATDEQSVVTTDARKTTVVIHETIAAGN